MVDNGGTSRFGLMKESWTLDGAGGCDALGAVLSPMRAH